MAQRRPASSPAPEDPGSQKIRVFKTVPAIQTGSARKLVPALTSHAAPEPDHECTHVLLGEDDLILDQEQVYLQECEKTFLEAKLRELGSTLLRKLFRVDYPNAIVPWKDTRGLSPEQHFKLWLQNQTEKEQLIFTFTPPVHTAPVSPSGQARQPLQQITLINGVEYVQTGSGQGQNASPWTQPEIFGTATRITIGQLADVLQSLPRTTNEANVFFHKLTVRDVVDILTHNSTIETLGKEPYEHLGALVVAILGRPLSQPYPTDLPKSFKKLVKEFREGVKEATFLTKIDHEWKKAYEDEFRREELIKRGLGVLMFWPIRL
ncbi:hypothetical protein L211DRAFT_890214 [Terfezia boudieri ATCC MYA-4762]|uniref:Uncharacterized protein n=1 Tax=Terfezia boudieri ATCC MYA-4762 TaxID=1051890 RepID=A0A3N4LE39_9PEZI|nr:hypothetical protein L211DRAFT_890214 [Terfezia boudieri ATCC MYA-4762]